MYLKRLDILGFKSFADKTGIQFRPGITAIVGPNGCGKSNIADALLWALGEQSSKTLRGERMEDVLFNGSERRKPLGLSEVSLTFADVQGQIEGDAFTTYREVTITRRLYRSGESEYLINKIPCRLKDIRDLLIDAGAGGKGHTIIEQGRVDRILNASPLERREIVEETAGIAKYKLRKTESLRKLEATKQNIARVRDIISEVQRQMNSLDRQAKKAERYSSLKSEIRELEIRLAAFQYRSLKATLSRLEGEHERMRVSETAAVADLSKSETAIEQTRLDLVEEEAALSRFREDVAGRDSEIQAGEHRIEVLRLQIQEWEAQAKRTEEDITQLGAALEDGAALLSRLQDEADTARRALTESEAQLELEEGRLVEVDREIAAVDEAIESAKSRFFTVMAELTEVRNEEAAVAYRKSELERLGTKASQETERLEKQLGETDRSLVLVRDVLAEAERRLEERSREGITIRERIAEGEAALTVCEECLASEVSALHALQARLESLEEVRTQLIGYQDGVRSILRAEGGLPSSVRGILADAIDVPLDYEKAIEAALGERLQTLVCEGVSDIRAAVDYLRRNEGGRARFIASGAQNECPPSPTSPPPGWTGRAIDLVTIKPGYESAVRALLGRTAVLSDLDAALAFGEWRRGYDTAVTLAGEVVEVSGVVSGGSEDRNRGLLQTRREIKTLETAVAQAQGRVPGLETERERRREALATLGRSIETLEEDCHRIEIERAARATELDALTQERTRLVGQLEILRAENEQRLEEEERLGLSAETLRARRSELESSQGDEECRLSALQDKVKVLRQERNAIGERLTESKVAATGLGERLEGFSANQARTEAAQEERRTELTGERERLADLTGKIESAAMEMQERRSVIDETIERKRGLQAAMIRQSDTCARLEGTIRDREELYRVRRRETEELGRKRQESELRLSEIRLTMEHLQQSVRDDYREDVASLSERYRDVEMQPEAAEEALSELKAAVEAMGPVNLTAIEEFKELEERHTFLTRQETDLTEAINSLHQAIAKINQTTRKMFMETFTQLRDKFSEVFVQFFQGGRAELILLDEQNPLESGVEIAAQPPGKKLKNISLLSGGERALTAISLLFASFLIHPTPFCLLDEIDAPLDDENIRRFTQVLKKMSESSQFLIITHNKRTMETADILYGVTMEEAGVSKIVSVNFQTLRGDQPPVNEAAMMAQA